MARSISRPRIGHRGSASASSLRQADAGHAASIFGCTSTHRGADRLGRPPPHRPRIDAVASAIARRISRLRRRRRIRWRRRASARVPWSLSLSRSGRRLRSVSGRGSPGRRSAIVPPNDSSSRCALPLPSVSVKRFCGFLDRPLHRERRAEAAVVGPHHQHGVHFFGHRHRDQPVVRRQAVEALVLDRAVVGDVAVDRVEIDVARVDPVEDDAAVGRLGGEIAADVGEADAFVHGADFDAALRFLQRDFALNRLERDEAGAAASR